MPRGVRAGLAVLAFVVALPATPAPGGSSPTTTADPATAKRQVDAEHSRLAQQYDESLAQEADLVAAWELSKQRSTELATELAGLETELTTTITRLAVAREAEDAANQALADELDRLNQARLDLAERQSELRRSAVAAYVENSSLIGLQGLGKMGSAEQMSVSLAYARHINHLRETRVDAVEHAEARIEILVQSSEEKQRKAEDARAAVEAERAQLQQVRDERAAAKAAADAESERQAALVAEVRATREAYEARLADLEQESARIAEVLRQQAAATSTVPPTTAPRPATTAAPRTTAAAPVTQAAAPGTTAGTTAAATSPTTKPASTTTAAMTSTTNTGGTGPPPPAPVALSYPLPGWPIVSKYGWRVHPILGVRRLHEGIDIWAPEGTGIQAAGPGQVIWVGPRNGYGNAVFIDHGSGFATVYAHLSGFDTSVGERVATGDVIGFVGQTGLAAGPHLHFETRSYGKSYDPLLYVTPR